MTDPIEEPTAPETAEASGEPLNIKLAGHWLGSLLVFASCVVAPCTLAVLRHTVAPGLGWWEITLPLWGAPAIVVGIFATVAGVLAIVVGLIVGVALLVGLIIGPVVTAALVWGYLGSLRETVARWIGNWRARR